MNTIHAGPKDREKILAWLDQHRKNVEDVLNQGGMVTLHSQIEMTEFEYGNMGSTDFRYEGWTFGVSVGPYPKRKP